MPSRNPPASTRRGKGFTKAETTTLLKAVERILSIDTEGWTEVHEIFNSKHSSRGVEGLKRKFNKLANKPVPTGNPNIPEDVKLAKSIKGKLFRQSGATNLSDEEEEEEEDEEEEELDDDVVTETTDENIPSQPLITEAEVQEILNNEEEENNSAIAVEVSEEVTDTQAAVVAPPESPTTAMQQGTPSLNRLAIAAAQSSLTNQRVLQTGIRHGATRKKQTVESSKADSGMGDMLEIMKMDMMSQMQQCHDQRESERERREDERICREEERSRREEERSRRHEDSQFMRMMMMAMMGNMRNPSPNTNANVNAENSNDQKRKAEEKQEE